MLLFVKSQRSGDTVAYCHREKKMNSKSLALNTELFIMWAGMSTYTISKVTCYCGFCVKQGSLHLLLLLKW